MTLVTGGPTAQQKQLQSISYLQRNLKENVF